MYEVSGGVVRVKLGFVFFVFLLLLSSCIKWQKASNFQNILYQRWLGATTIHSIHPYIKQNESIKRPRGTWQKLFAVSFYDRSFEIQHDCLYYRVPTQQLPGKLVVTFNANNSLCNEAPPEKFDITKDQIYNFSYEISLNLQSKNHLKLMIDETEMLFDFINLNSQAYNFELASHSIQKGRMTGLKVSSPVNSITESNLLKLADGVLCHGIDKNCKTRSNYRCEQCESGWYEVVSSDCPSQYNKICGQDNCGKRGQPACIRGRVSSEYKLGYCINDSPIGFCDEGLRVYCNANQLVCR
jgi:hypothetical protein